MPIRSAVQETPKEQTDDARQWPPPQGEWTYEDWAKLPDDGWRYEVIKGELHMTPAPTPQHQRVSRRLQRALEDFIFERELGEIFDAPIDVMLPGQETPVQPDLVFIPIERADMIGDVEIEGTPPLLVEVLSGGNWVVDRRTKFKLYADCGVQEYWIVDPNPKKRTIEVYTLVGEQYELVNQWEAGEVAHSVLLDGFEVAVDDVFASPMADA